VADKDERSSLEQADRKTAIVILNVTREAQKFETSPIKTKKAVLFAARPAFVEETQRGWKSAQREPRPTDP
jgi:hypothetical protein